MRRRFLQQTTGLAAALALPRLTRASTAKLPRLVLAGPFAAVSNPFYRMVDSGALSDVAETVEMRPWRLSGAQRTFPGRSAVRSAGAVGQCGQAMASSVVGPGAK